MRISLLLACTSAVLWARTLNAQGPTLNANDPPPIQREFRAAWVATVTNIDWPSRPDLDTWTQQAELLAILNRAVALHRIAIIFQLRPGSVWIFVSRLDPWA